MCVEPTLQPITGEALSGTSAITEDGARLDVAASGFWKGRFERVFFDVRIFNPHAPSNRHPSPPVTENIKKQAYEERIREVEHGSFTPLSCLSQGSLLSSKWDQPYSSTIAWIRYSLCFSLLRSSIQCMLVNKPFQLLSLFLFPLLYTNFSLDHITDSLSEYFQFYTLLHYWHINFLV